MNSIDIGTHDIDRVLLYLNSLPDREDNMFKAAEKDSYFCESADCQLPDLIEYSFERIPQLREKLRVLFAGDERFSAKIFADIIIASTFKNAPESVTKETEHAIAASTELSDRIYSGTGAAPVRSGSGLFEKQRQMKNEDMQGKFDSLIYKF